MKKKKLALFASLLVIAAACLFLGLRRGEQKTVQDKGSVICTECIGLG